MKELALILASVATKEMLIKFLKDAITEFEDNPTDEHFDKLVGTCSLILSKKMVGDGESGLEKAMNDVARIEKADKLLDTTKN